MRPNVTDTQWKKGGALETRPADRPHYIYLDQGRRLNGEFEKSGS